MKRYLYVISLLCIGLISIMANAQAERTLVWNKTPITLVIPVGEEVRLTWPTDVNIQIPMAIASSLETLAPNQRVVYWKAASTFDAARVIATSLDNETVYLIDLVASDKASAAPVRLEDPDRLLNQPNEAQAQWQAAVSDVQQLEDPVEVILTRFASQSLYAPRRLVPISTQISRLPGAAIPADIPLIRSQASERYRVEVVGSWAGFGRYITAVMVINQSDFSVRVHPGWVQGNFSHITSQHLALAPRGSLEDRTTLYLISSVPFESAILEDGYGY